ncbi:AfsR/SARP family transcriptional regulator [Streptomyces sp. NBC_01237]|uniref:AfsR/SARP family transcriptional regulator n=1 Tax=Streptomyces sp. NBC_01237 TaxID=2903790 RepID=UPI002DD9FB41|nr:BTAD domain-containing putative transcriptional regulator [Streptomyces sp. NBC_01237]WRZ73288.1 tetratricopeptide repeat protein [Streptomyces sp. NBC_01237]
MTRTLSFKLLGPLEISADGETIRVSSARQRAVLATLLLSPDRTVSVAALTEAVWQGTPPTTARNQIAICITTLRKLFREKASVEDLIETRHPGYILHSKNCYIDLQDLSESVARARLTSAHDERLDEATALFEHALALWRGPVLEGLAGDRIDDTVTQLSEFRLDINEEYAALQLRLGGHHSVITRLTALVKEHPLREQARAHLMHAHNLAGRRAEALQVYREGRRALVDELGIEPGPALQELHQQILQDANELEGFGERPAATAPPALLFPSLAPLHAASPAPADATVDTNADRGTTAAPAHTPAPAQPHTPAPAPAGNTHGVTVAVPAQLPLPVHAFTGRLPAISVLDGLLPGDNERGPLSVAVISGVSGIGKSALAAHWANRVAERFPDGQLFIDVHGYHEFDKPLSPMSVLDQSLRGLGVPSAQIPAHLQERSALYRSLLNNRKLLIILDDVRSFTQIQPLLPGRGQCFVLITSRDPLDELTSDYAAVRIHLKVMTPDEADSMLATVIGAERVATDPASAARLVDLCGRLPLALRIAAGRLATRPHWSLRQLTTRLEDRYRRLDVLSPNDGGVRAGFWLSYRELSPDAARLYRRLGLLPVTTFAAWTAAAVLDVDIDQAEDLLEQLVDAQLLEVSTLVPGAPVRFRFQELLRLFAWERAHAEDSDGDRDDTIERAYGTMLTLADTAHRQLYGKGHLAPHRARLEVTLPEETVGELLADPLEWFESERTSLVSMVAHAAQSGASAHAWGLTARTMPLFEMRNYLEDWQQTAQTALDGARSAGDDPGATIMLRSLGTLAIYQRRYAEADSLLSSAMELLEGSDDLHERAIVLRNLALCSRFKGDLDNAARYCREALDHFGRTDDPTSRSHALGLLAQIELERGETGLGITLLREAIRTSDEAGSVRGKAQNIYRLAEAYLRAGELPRVEETCREVIALTRAQGDRLGEAYALRALGEAYWRQNRSTEAEAILRDALTAAEDVGDRFLQARIETDRACAEAIRGDSAAVARLQRARDIFRFLAATAWEERTAQITETVGTTRQGVHVDADTLARLLGTR